MMIAVENREEIKQRVEEVGNLYIEARRSLRTTGWSGHPKQIEAARKLFELWPHIEHLVRSNV